MEAQGRIATCAMQRTGLHFRKSVRLATSFADSSHDLGELPEGVK